MQFLALVENGCLSTVANCVVCVCTCESEQVMAQDSLEEVDYLTDSLLTEKMKLIVYAIHTLKTCPMLCSFRN